jgi:VWFA-related protein
MLWASLILSHFLWAQAPTNSGSGAPSEQSNSVPVFRASASLVVVDVIAQNPKTGMPVSALHRTDFRLFDNGHEVPITTFDTGATYSTRPIVLWFVVICNEKNNGPKGELASGSFTGKEALFRAALNDLDKNDRVGVAHWCDNGDSVLDLQPTQDRDTAISALIEALKPFNFATPPPSQRRQGERALQQMIRLIVEDAHHRNPQPLPVIVMLHSDHTGMPKQELDELVNDLLETSGIVFGIKDADVPDFYVGTGRLPRGEWGSVLHYMAEETGGQYFSIHPNLYTTALDSVLLQVHFRYELGFKPSAIDGKRHELKVEFAGEAKEQNKTVRLRYRPEYIPNGGDARTPIAVK